MERASGIQAFGNERKIGEKNGGEAGEMEEGKGGWKVVKEERDGGMERTVY